MQRIVVVLLLLVVLYNQLHKDNAFSSEQAKAADWGKRHYLYSGKGQDKLSALSLRETTNPSLADAP